MLSILHIETSSQVCSLALSVDDKVVFDLTNPNDFSHAAKLGNFALETIEFAKKNNFKIDAVAISAGPGSYTGLRIGASLAKGLCYGLEIPLIAISTLKIMARQLVDSFYDIDEETYLCPMIDARRMEVYAAIYDKHLTLVRDVRADIVDAHTYEEYVSMRKVLFFGNGAAKCKAIIHSPQAAFVDNIHPLAKTMSSIAFEAFQTKNFVDTAYFEPFYLKEFQATVAKNKLF